MIETRVQVLALRLNGVVLAIVGWGWVMRTWKWLWPKLGLTALILIWAGAAVQETNHSPVVVHAAGDAIAAGGYVLAGLIVIRLLWFIASFMPKGMSTTGAVLIQIGVYGFFVLIPPLLVSLVTSGGSWSAAGRALLGEGGHGFLAYVLGFVRFACQLASLLLLVGVPAALRRRLPWNDASNLAKSLVPSWLAAAATVLTWLYIVLLHFGGGALAKDSLSLIAVAGLGAALLLVPLFQFVARSCWEYGFVTVFDPVRWGGAFRAVHDEVRRARKPRVPHEADKPISGST